jgi:transposase
MTKKKEESRDKPNISVKSMGHLGLVAGMIDRLGLVELLDEALPCQQAKGSKVSHGLRVKAMLLSALGFTDNRLYIFPEFLEDVAVNRLLKTDINPKHFNDDALGRSLDAIHIRC